LMLSKTLTADTCGTAAKGSRVVITINPFMHSTAA
jgi:hypothetical protein